MLKYCLCSALFHETIYSWELKFLQVVYESFDCDLTQEIFNSWFQWRDMPMIFSSYQHDEEEEKEEEEEEEEDENYEDAEDKDDDE